MILINMKSRILLSVYAIYCIRKFKNPLVTESFALTILMMVLFYFVSISSVMTNMLASESSYLYFLRAFSEADLIIQLVLMLIGVVGLLFVRNIAIYSRFKQRFSFT